MDSISTRCKTIPGRQSTLGRITFFALVMLLSAALSLAVLALATALHQQERRHMQESLQAEANMLTAHVQADISARVSALYRLAARWRARGGMDKEEFLSDAQLVYADFPGFQALQWIDTSLSVRWIYPLVGNEEALGSPSAFEERRLAALEKSRNDGVAAITEPVELLQGGVGFLLYLPLVKDEQFDGFLLAVFRLESWLRHALAVNHDNGPQHFVRIDFGDEQVLLDQAGETVDESPDVISRSEMRSVPLAISLWASADYKAGFNSKLPLVVAVSGVMVSILLGAALLLWRRAATSAEQAHRSQMKLRQEIKERKTAQDLLHKLAYYDSLTGLASRRLAMDRLQMALSMARDQKTKIAVLFIDLDGFKGVNDSWGHELGDKVLCKVADQLSDAVRDIDTVARLGGDEFLAVLTSLDKPTDALRIAERIREQIANASEFHVLGKDVTVTINVSIGVALYPKHGADATELLAQADAAMYESKKAGKNRCTLASEK